MLKILLWIFLLCALSSAQTGEFFKNPFNNSLSLWNFSLQSSFGLPPFFLACNFFLSNLIKVTSHTTRKQERCTFLGVSYFKLVLWTFANLAFFSILLVTHTQLLWKINHFDSIMLYIIIETRKRCRIDMMDLSPYVTWYSYSLSKSYMTMAHWYV